MVGIFFSFSCRPLIKLIPSLFLVVKWENEQATVKLLDDVSNGEIEEENEEPEGEENICDEKKSILESQNGESKTVNILSNDIKSNSVLSSETKSILDSTEHTSDNEQEQLDSDIKEE